MKFNFILFLFFVFQVYTVQAQYTIYFAVNNKECTNCLSQLSDLKNINPSYKKVLVFSKQNELDSAALIKRLYLFQYKQNIIWSDSLYDLLKLKQNGFESSVTLLNKENRESIQIPLSHLSENVAFLNRFGKNIDTLSFENAHFSIENNLESNDSYIYSFNNTSKQMLVFNRFNNTLLYKISLTDSLNEVAFKLKYGKNGAEKWLKNSALYEKEQTIDPNIYKTYFIAHDTLWLLGVHKDIISKAGNDSLTTETLTFLTLSTYKGNKLIDFTLVENYLGPEFKNIGYGLPTAQLGKKYNDCNYVILGEFFIYAGTPYFYVINNELFPKLQNYFLAKYKKEGKRKWIFDQFYNRDLPNIYLKNLNYGMLATGTSVTALPYFALYGSDHLFSVDDKINDITLNILNKEPALTLSQGLWDLKMTKNFIYMIVMDLRIHEYCYLKYDIHGQKEVLYIPISDYKSSAFMGTPKIDDLNFDFVLIPVSPNKLLRTHISTLKN